MTVNELKYFASTVQKSLLCGIIRMWGGKASRILSQGKLDGHQKRLAATVVRFPFYDPEKTRVRM